MNADMQKILGTRSHRSLSWPCFTLFLVLALVWSAAWCSAAVTNAPAVTTGKVDEANTQDTLRAYLQLQEQIHATQLAIERSRKEADASAVENAKGYTSRLQTIEQALTSQKNQALEAVQSSNRVLLIVAGVFAALGFLSMLFMAYSQSRTISRLAEIAAAMPAARALGPGTPVAALGAGNGDKVIPASEQSSQRLLSALERLEQSIRQIERASYPPTQHSAATIQAAPVPAAPPGEGAGTTPEAARISVLLGKGQSLLSLDQPEEAIVCFDQVLALDPNHPEALVKKGAALERLRKVEEAVACYDRAIAADNSLTVAYLYKGGLFNRMERFSEALKCYEQALRTQEDRRG